MKHKFVFYQWNYHPSNSPAGGEGQHVTRWKQVFFHIFYRIGLTGCCSDWDAERGHLQKSIQKFCFLASSCPAQLPQRAETQFVLWRKSLKLHLRRTIKKFASDSSSGPCLAQRAGALFRLSRSHVTSPNARAVRRRRQASVEQLPACPWGIHCCTVSKLWTQQPERPWQDASPPPLLGQQTAGAIFGSGGPAQCRAQPA